MLTALIAAARGYRAAPVETPPEGPGPVASIAVTPASFTLAPGATRQLAATARDANSVLVPDASLAWSSSDTDVATVSSTGLVTGVAGGSATITASAGVAEGTSAMTVAITEPLPVPNIGEFDVAVTSFKGAGTRRVHFTVPLLPGSEADPDKITAWRMVGDTLTEIAASVRLDAGRRLDASPYLAFCEVDTEVAGFLGTEDIRIRTTQTVTVPRLVEQGYQPGTNTIRALAPDPSDPTKLLFPEFFYVAADDTIFHMPEQQLAWPTGSYNITKPAQDAPSPYLSRQFSLYGNTSTGAVTMRAESTTTAAPDDLVSTIYGNAAYGLGQFLGTFGIGVNRDEYAGAALEFGTTDLTTTGVFRPRHRLVDLRPADVVGTVVQAEYKCACEWTGNKLVPLDMELSLGSAFTSWHTFLMEKHLYHFQRSGGDMLGHTTKRYDDGMHCWFQFCQVDGGLSWWLKAHAMAERHLYRFVAAYDESYGGWRTDLNPADSLYQPGDEPYPVPRALATMRNMTGDERYMEAVKRVALTYDGRLDRQPYVPGQPRNMYTPRAWSRFLSAIRWLKRHGYTDVENNAGQTFAFPSLDAAIEGVLDYYEQIENYPQGPGGHLNGPRASDGWGAYRLTTDDYCYGVVGFGVSLCLAEQGHLYHESYPDSRLRDWTVGPSDYIQSTLYDPDTKWYHYTDLSHWPAAGPPNTSAPNGINYLPGDACAAYEGVPERHLNGHYMEELVWRYIEASALDRAYWAAYILDVYTGMRSSDMNNMNVYGQNAYAGKTGAWAVAHSMGLLTSGGE